VKPLQKDAVRREAYLSANARVMVPGPPVRSIHATVGDWRVQQRVWPSKDAEPVTLPPMVAHRRMISAMLRFR
jgi:hypothetical protein